MIKEGWKTSEFWAMVVTSIVNILVMTGLFTPAEGSDLAKVIPVVSSGIGQAIVVIGYAIARGKAKSK